MANILHVTIMQEINIQICSDTSIFTATSEPKTVVDELEYRHFNSNIDSDGDYYNTTAIAVPNDFGKCNFSCTECFEIMEINKTHSNANALNFYFGTYTILECHNCACLSSSGGVTIDGNEEFCSMFGVNNEASNIYVRVAVVNAVATVCDNEYMISLSIRYRDYDCVLNYGIGFGSFLNVSLQIRFILLNNIDLNITQLCKPRYDFSLYFADVFNVCSDARAQSVSYKKEEVWKCFTNFINEANTASEYDVHSSFADLLRLFCVVSDDCDEIHYHENNPFLGTAKFLFMNVLDLIMQLILLNMFVYMILKYYMISDCNGIIIYENHTCDMIYQFVEMKQSHVLCGVTRNDSDLEVDRNRGKQRASSVLDCSNSVAASVNSNAMGNKSRFDKFRDGDASSNYRHGSQYGAQLTAGNSNTNTDNSKDDTRNDSYNAGLSLSAGFVDDDDSKTVLIGILQTNIQTFFYLSESDEVLTISNNSYFAAIEFYFESTKYFDSQKNVNILEYGIFNDF